MGLGESHSPAGLVVEATPQGYRMEHPDYDAAPAYNLTNSPPANMPHSGPLPTGPTTITLGAAPASGAAAPFAVSNT